VNALLLVVGLWVPRDTVLVELYLVPTAARMVAEAVEDDSTLLLPANALHELLGIPPPPSPWVSLAALRRAYPTIVVRWSPEMGQVAIWDELNVLPAVRKFRESYRAAALGAIPLPQFSGPYGAFSVDDQHRALAELGYLWKGRVSLSGRVDDRGVGQWTASAAPTPHLFVSGLGGTTQPTTVTGRVQAGPLWFLTSYVPHQSLDVSGLVRLGPVQMFAGRQFAVLTLHPTGQLVVQAARSWRTHRTVARLSFGPYPASPFSFPVASLSH